MKYWCHDFWRTSGPLRPFSVAIILLLLSLGVDGQPQNPTTSNFECRPNGCCDQHEWCKFWSSIGECESNPVWMGPNCQLACRTCPRPNAGSGSGGGGGARPVSRGRPSGRRGNVGGGRCGQISGGSRREILGALKSEGLIVAREDTTRRPTLSVDDVNRSNGQSFCTPTLRSGQCSPNVCYHLMYRTFDGSCNNFKKSLSGAAFTPLKRLLPPIYDNGIEAPVASQRSSRPSAREATRFLLSSSQSVLNNEFNAMLMQWGQFLTHDIARTTLLPASPCTSCNDVAGRCFNIKTVPTDPRFGQFGCIRTARSSPVCGTGRQTPREQFNENTAFIDASQVYGSSEHDMQKFRDGRSGFLRVSQFNNQILMPFDQSSCKGPGSCPANFQAGDNRANIFVGLVALHTLFVREHNRIARRLQTMNPQWNGDRLFQETRKIVGAEMQVITFDEFLPKILGSAATPNLGNFTRYDDTIDPSIANSFTTAAFRFGHGMIQEFYQRLNSQGRPIRQGGLKFSEGVFQSNKILFDGGIDPVLRGLMTTPAKRPQRLAKTVTEQLFGSTDLASLNIQRGRDHGLQGYNAWRQFCRLGRAADFDALRVQMLDANVRANLRQGFRSVDDVDLYVGAMLEDPVRGGMVGTTLACLIGEQFRRLRDGDRFWYENPGVFTPAQRNELRKTTLARLLCDNCDNFAFTPRDAFRMTTGPSLVSCNDIAGADLNKWNE